MILNYTFYSITNETMIMELIVIFLLIATLYSYFIYPVLVMLLPKRHEDAVNDHHIVPFDTITIIITAHNEEDKIESKIKNTLRIDYPKEKLEIIVASDASIDGTDDIVEKYKDKGVKLLRVADRKGKENAQYHAIKAAEGNILVFSDVATILDSSSLNRINALFADPRIGAVSSVDRIINADGEVLGEGAYVKYEMWLRSLESRLNSLVGLSGSFFAARKDVCRSWDITIPSDFNTALNCMRMGYIAVSDSGLVGTYKNIASKGGEYLRKYRTVIRGMAAISVKNDVLNPFKYGLFSFQVWSHKIFRWLVPWFMFLLLILSLFTYSTSFFIAVLLVLQLVFYMLALLGFVIHPLRGFQLFNIPFYFMQVNFAIAHASVDFLAGKRITMWAPSKR